MFIALRLLSYSAPSGAACTLSRPPHCAPPERGTHKNRKTINIVLLRSTSLRNRARTPRLDRVSTGSGSDLVKP